MEETRNSLAEQYYTALLKRIDEQIKAYKWFKSEKSRGASLAECVAHAQIILRKNDEFIHEDW